MEGSAFPSAGGAASAVDHRPHESLTSVLKSRRRWPTVDLARRLLNNCTPRRRSTSSRRRSPQCEVCSPYRAVRRNTRAKFGWRGQTGVRRLKIARGSLSTAVELGGASNHMPRRTTTRPQTPSRLTSRRYAGEPKLASRACSTLAGRVLNYALILATLTPLSSWLTVAGRVLLGSDLRPCQDCDSCWRKRVEHAASWEPAARVVVLL
jgi:hypothetical protein